MAADTPMSQAVRLGAATDALAALAAHLRLETEHLPADPAVRAVLADVAAELLGREVGGDGAVPVVGLARTFLRQAAELVENPGRAGAWDQVDPPLLQSIGRLSMGIADAVRSAEDTLPGLTGALVRPGATLLDVGTGTGWLAIALARAHPALRVTGIDVFAPALELARANVADAGLTDRIDLRIAPALSTLRSLPSDPVIDFAFVDADKTGYPDYYAELVPRLRPGGLLVIDNVLRAGRVLLPADASDRAVAGLNDLIVSDDRVESVMLPVRDGVTLARKRH